MIQLQNVTKRIKENTVLDNVSYTFKSGFVYGLYGQNGSGKTMLLRAISGLINLDSGSIFIDGEKLHDKIEFPPETGIVIENMELLPECSAKRNLQMLAKIKNIADEKDIIFSLERVGLDPDSEKKVKKFSLGMKQRLNIAQAIFENQKIILLDEPTNALDEEAVQLIYKIIREEKSRGATIIVATHHKEDLKEVCDVILKIGREKLLRKMKINKYFLGIVLIIIIIMYFMAGVLFLGNTREDNNMKVSTEQQEIAYQTFKSETEGYSLASKYAENLQNNSLDKEAINLQLQEAKKFLQDNIKGISRESDNFAQMFYYCGIIYGLDRKYNCGDYEFVKVGMEVRGYIINVQNGDMDDELEADLYDKLTKLTADDIQEVVNAIDN
uniref:ABC transporter ATP-binding protein n=1 Tax=Agathobacter rectalis TaxID=39491 RepID=UPI0040299E20